MVLTAQVDARTDEQRQHSGAVTDGRTLPTTTPYRPGPARIDIYADEFAAASQATGVSEAWLRAIAHVESAFKRTARSPKGAMGIMQLMPQTARRHQVTDPFSPAQSILGGARELRALSERFNGDLTLIAAGYNAGPGAVRKYAGVPPYNETQNYIVKVLAMYERYKYSLAQAGKPQGVFRPPTKEQLAMAPPVPTLALVPPDYRLTLAKRR